MSRSLWMGDLDPYMDETFINRAFLPISQPLSVKVIRRKDSGQPAGYCFIEFATESEAERVLKLVNATDIPGSNPTKRFRLNRSQAGKMWDVGPSHSVFVGDLDATVTDDRLEDFFSKRYRSVKGAKIMWEERGFSRGYGFVRFSDEAEMRRALLEMQGAQGLGNKPIRVSIATPKSSKTEPAAVAVAAVTTTNTSTTTAAMDTYTQQWLQQQQTQSYDPYAYYQQYYNYYGCYPTAQQYGTYYQQQHAATTTGAAAATTVTTTPYTGYPAAQVTTDHQNTTTANGNQQSAVTDTTTSGYYYQQQQYDAASHHQQQVAASTVSNSTAAALNAMNIFEDPNQPLDMDWENLKYFHEKTGILDQILGSHWQPLDCLTSKIAEQPVL